MPTGSSRYPQPGPTGGRLIREVIALLRAQAKLELPLSSHILCATSAGLDSTALALLLVKYGRRVGAKISLLHINHGWRGDESDADERHAVEQARAWGVPIEVVRLKKPEAKGRSLEDAAREQRREVYTRLSARLGDALVFTAHHADDVAETLLWRLFSGQAATHGAGILAREGCEVRPLLRVRKSELRKFLEEEGVSWREDRTNHEGRFLRSKMRAELMPAIEKLFPAAVDHLVDAATRAAAESGDGWMGESPTKAILFAAAGLKTRRAHFQALATLDSGAQLDLPDGWILRHEREKRNQIGYGKTVKNQLDRWVLERPVNSGKNTKKHLKASGR